MNTLMTTMNPIKDNVLCSNKTNNNSVWSENRSVVFAIAIAESFAVIILNTLFLVLSWQIPHGVMNQLHIFLSFLGTADLCNGVYHVFLSTSFFFENVHIFHLYPVCFTISILNNIGLVTTGYMLLLLNFVKCFSIVFPLQCLQIISRNVAIVLSCLIWIFCYAVIGIPSLSWMRLVFYLPNEECDIRMAYHEHLPEFLQIGVYLTIAFFVGIAVFNTTSLVSIRRQRKVWVAVGKRNADSSATDQTTVSHAKEDGNGRYQNDFKGRIPNNYRKPSCSGSKTALPGTSDERNLSPNLTYIMAPIFGSDTANNEAHVTARINRWRIENSPDIRSQPTTNQSTYRSFKKSKHFKSYRTVLSSIGFNLLCGTPFLACTSIPSLSTYFYQSRNMRMICSMSLHLTSLINPILTITNIQVYKKTFVALKEKCKSKMCIT